jgi:hypothetical protein
MATTEQLRAEATTMQRYLEELCPADPVQINERIRTLQVYMARSGEMLAQAKELLNRKRSQEIAQTIVKIAREGHLSAKAQNVLVDSLAAEESFLVDWIDRINATCTHQADHTRSLLAYEREQMRLLRTGY